MNDDEKEEMLKRWIRMELKSSEAWERALGREEVLKRHIFAGPNQPTMKHPDDVNLPISEWDNVP